MTLTAARHGQGFQNSFPAPVAGRRRGWKVRNRGRFPGSNARRKIPEGRRSRKRLKLLNLATAAFSFVQLRAREFAPVTKVRGNPLKSYKAPLGTLAGRLRQSCKG